jgi:hypothetical protein
MTPVILSKDFDPVKLPPGEYMASSVTPAYGILQTMAQFGMASVVSERALDALTWALTVRVGKQSGRQVRDNPKQHHVMSMTNESFQKVPNDYGDTWKHNWWREAIQNSVDAGAKNVTLTCKQNDDMTWDVQCEDDGSGMTPDILINKFFMFSTTTKVSGTSAGGFGKAKELLILPWIKWSVKTGMGDGMVTLAEGAGNQIDYETVKDQKAFKGTILSVTMPNDKHIEACHAEEYIKHCWLPAVTLTVNGSVVDADMRNGTKARDLSHWATVFHTPTSQKYRGVFVRTREGLFMFEQFLPNGVEGYIVIQINVPSIQALTSNRNGISNKQLDTAIDAFLSELSRNVMSALRDKSKEVHERIMGEGLVHAKVEEAQAEVRMTLQRNIKYGKRGVTVGAGTIAQSIASALKNMGVKADSDNLDIASSIEIAKLYGGMQFAGVKHIETLAKHLAWRPDFYLVNEDKDHVPPKQFTRPEHFAPSILRLLRVWTELCRMMLVLKNCDRSFGVGFIFSPPTGRNTSLGMHVRSEGIDWLLINPFTKPERKDPWNLASEEHQNQLAATALHEVVHMADRIGDHDEQYSTALTDSIGICAPAFKLVKKVVKLIPLREKKETAAVESGVEDKGDVEPKFDTVVPAKEPTSGAKDSLLRQALDKFNAIYVDLPWSQVHDTVLAMGQTENPDESNVIVCDADGSLLLVDPLNYVAASLYYKRNIPTGYEDTVPFFDAKGSSIPKNGKLEVRHFSNLASFDMVRQFASRLPTHSEMILSIAINVQELRGGQWVSVFDEPVRFVDPQAYVRQTRGNWIYGSCSDRECIAAPSATAGSNLPSLIGLLDKNEIPVSVYDVAHLRNLDALVKAHKDMLQKPDELASIVCDERGELWITNADGAGTARGEYIYSVKDGMEVYMPFVLMYRNSQYSSKIIILNNSASFVTMRMILAGIEGHAEAQMKEKIDFVLWERHDGGMKNVFAEPEKMFIDDLLQATKANYFYGISLMRPKS